LTFDVLSDVGNHTARRFGLVYALPEELRAALRSNNKALPGINGDESWELPVPATYVIAPNGRIALAYIEVDYRKAPRARRDSRRVAIASALMNDDE
jgi:peroxiredoxin